MASQEKKPPAPGMSSRELREKHASEYAAVRCFPDIAALSKTKAGGPASVVVVKDAGVVRSLVKTTPAASSKSPRAPARTFDRKLVRHTRSCLYFSTCGGGVCVCVCVCAGV